jgi:TPR repeat protein
MRKVWIEAALNGGWSRALQPGIPVTVEEIVAEGIACARAGAEGDGVRRDLKVARQWFEKAAALGDLEARQNLREMRR